uniref:Uncharacterized protein n=1 Tax=Meloidogyne javanica TaxID=6303 RepID=A0A915LHI3_MELJA
MDSLKFVPDWWIYGAICIAAGILNIFANADCPFWRFLASTVIVLGTIETLVEQSSFLNIEARDALTGQTLPSARDELATEGRLILLPALATFLTISTRLETIEGIEIKNMTICENLNLIKEIWENCKNGTLHIENISIVEVLEFLFDCVKLNKLTKEKIINSNLIDQKYSNEERESQFPYIADFLGILSLKMQINL